MLPFFDRLEAPQGHEYLIFVFLDLHPGHGTHLENVDYMKVGRTEREFDVKSGDLGSSLNSITD